MPDQRRLDRSYHESGLCRAACRSQAVRLVLQAAVAHYDAARSPGHRVCCPKRRICNAAGSAQSLEPATTRLGRRKSGGGSVPGAGGTDAALPPLPRRSRRPGQRRCAGARQLRDRDDNLPEAYSGPYLSLRCCGAGLLPGCGIFWLRAPDTPSSSPVPGFGPAAKSKRPVRRAHGRASHRWAECRREKILRPSLLVSVPYPWAGSDRCREQWCPCS